MNTWLLKLSLLLALPLLAVACSETEEKATAPDRVVFMAGFCMGDRVSVSMESSKFPM